MPFWNKPVPSSSFPHINSLADVAFNVWKFILFTMEDFWGLGISRVDGSVDDCPKDLSSSVGGDATQKKQQ